MLLFLFLAIINLYLLIPAAILQVFNSIAELAISIGIHEKKQNNKLKYIQ